MSSVPLGRKIYNEFANCLRDQGEVVPRWDEDVCDLSGTEVLAWIELAKINDRRFLNMREHIHCLNQKVQYLENRYRKSASTALLTMDKYGKKLSARS